MPTRLPDASERYDRQNEQQARRDLERADMDNVKTDVPASLGSPTLIGKYITAKISDLDADSGEITARDNMKIGSGTGYNVMATGGTDRWKVSPSGHLLTEADASYDIGASGGTRPRDMYLYRFMRMGGVHGMLSYSEVTALSASDVVLYGTGAPAFACTEAVTGALVCVRNFSIGGSAMFLLDATFAAAGVLVASNGGAIWVANAAPGVNEVRVSLSGTNVVVRAGANRNGNAITAMIMRWGA